MIELVDSSPPEWFTFLQGAIIYLAIVSICTWQLCKHGILIYRDIVEIIRLKKELKEYE